MVYIRRLLVFLLMFPLSLSAAPVNVCDNLQQQLVNHVPLQQMESIQAMVQAGTDLFVVLQNKENSVEVIQLNLTTDEDNQVKTNTNLLATFPNLVASEIRGVTLIPAQIDNSQTVSLPLYPEQGTASQLNLQGVQSNDVVFLLEKEKNQYLSFYRIDENQFIPLNSQWHLQGHIEVDLIKNTENVVLPKAMPTLHALGMTDIGQQRWLNASSLSDKQTPNRQQVVYNLYPQENKQHQLIDVSDWLAHADDKVTALALSPDIQTLFLATKSETDSDYQGQINLRCVALDNNQEWQSRGLRLAVNGKIGYLIDSAIEGIRFVSKGYQGITDKNGLFLYQNDEKVNFYLGDETTGVALGSASPSSGNDSGQQIVTVFDLAGSNDINNRKVINIGKLLQSLDEDQNPDNGITITVETKKIIAESNLKEKIKFDVATTDFANNNNIKELLTKISEKRQQPQRVLVSTDQAQKHLTTVRNRLKLENKKNTGPDVSKNDTNTGTSSSGSGGSSSSGGNNDATPTIDITAPEVPSINNLPTQTNQDSVTITVNGEADAQLFINNIGSGHLTTGTLDVNLDTSGHDGVKTFNLILQDGSNNKSVVLVVNIIKDATVPNAPTLTTTPTRTNQDHVTVIVNGEVGALLFIDGIANGMTLVNGTANVNLNTAGEDGDKSFQITQKDNANNISSPLTLTITKETISRAKALRFLKQSAFGASEANITKVMNKGYEQWIDAQFLIQSDLEDDSKDGYLHALFRMLRQTDPSTYPSDALFSDAFNNLPQSPDMDRYRIFSRNVWWHKALDNEDQLRQRVAYALSQILVVSDISPAGNVLQWRAESLAYYYDILYQHSFRNYRDLLTDVTYSPTMAYYMTYTGSRAESPDENYARELMQMFTIGLYQLNTDGSKQVDGNGNPVPSYTQNDVSELSKIFTGWYFDDTDSNAPFGKISKKRSSYVVPIKLTQEYHDTTEKSFLNKTITANQTAKNDIKSALDIIFNHANIAPFISRHLIMRLVTSNPSPAYVQRVATVFNDNGSGVKGDLKATVKAILMDTEARDDSNSNSSGKAQEMLITFTHFLKSFDVKTSTGWTYDSQTMTEKYWFKPSAFGQEPLGAPSVFNFYSPEYVPSSQDFATNSIVAPEFEIQNTPTLINYSNHLLSFTKNEKYRLVDLQGIYNSMDEWVATKTKSNISSAYLDLSPAYEIFEQTLDGDTDNDYLNIHDDTKRTAAVSALINHLDNKLLGETLPDDYKTTLINHLVTINHKNNNKKNRAYFIVASAVRAVATSSFNIILQ